MDVTVSGLWLLAQGVGGQYPPAMSGKLPTEHGGEGGRILVVTPPHVLGFAAVLNRARRYDRRRACRSEINWQTSVPRVSGR